MQDKLESGSQTSVTRRKRRIAIFAAGLLILAGLIPVVMLKTTIESREPSLLVMRVDDIQDFAFRDAQLFLLNESSTNHVPLSLAVIAGMFGEDREIVQTVKLSVSSGSEVAVHGWKHEDLAKLSYEEQAALLARSRSQIKEILDFDSIVLVPPMFSFSEDTIAAMREEGYNVISTSAELSEPGLISEVISLPATIELSDYSNGTWNMKNCDSVKVEISKSIQKYGFAVIVTHPQEFITDGKLNQTNTELYRTLLGTLKEDYSFITLERLGLIWQKATLEEKHKLLSGMLEAVYVDLAASRSIVGIQPKPPFYPLFEVSKQKSEAKATVQSGSDKIKGSTIEMEPENFGLVETGESLSLPETTLDWPGSLGRCPCLAKVLTTTIVVKRSSLDF